MAKLINILAASVGGGLVLGASIRLGEALGSSVVRGAQRHRVAPAAQAEEEGPNRGSARSLVNGRLDRLEEKLSRISPAQAERSRTDAIPPSAAPRASAEDAPEWLDVLAGVVARIDRQQADVEAIQRQMSGATRAADSIDEIAGNVRDDLHRQLREEMDRRLTALEKNLYLSVEAARKETVDAMMASMEARVTPRISRLENDVISQSAAMTELRDCSLQSERSIQRLLTALEKVVAPKTGAAEFAPGATDLSKLAVMASRQPDDLDAGGATARRPASFRNSNL
jgi:hypothetical protein